MSAPRLPTHLVFSGLIRATQAAGGFATVLARGDADSGILLILTMDRGENARLWERMPTLDGARPFVVSKSQEPEKEQEFTDYWRRRVAQDPDCWVIELDVPNPERLIVEAAG